MTVIAIYHFRAQFAVKPGFEDRYPTGTIQCEGMLFMAQVGPARNDAGALAAFPGYEVTDPEILDFGLLDPAVLETEAYSNYREQVDKALRTGSALLYFTPPDSGESGLDQGSPSQ